MNPLFPWLAILISTFLLVFYEVALAWAGRRHPETRARSAHALLRSEWVVCLAAHPGFEIVAVQTLRNSLMSATITASTAALALMGALSLSASSNAAVLSVHQMSPRSTLELMLLATLFASFVSSTMAMRYYNHAGFVMSLPAKSEQRERRTPMAIDYVRRAGLLYSWGLRFFLFVAPVVVGLVNEFAMPFAAACLVVVLRFFDRGPGFDQVEAEPV